MAERERIADEQSGKSRINEITQAIVTVADGNLSVQIKLSGKNDEIDALIMGLNMMIDDLRKSREENELKNKEIQSKVNALERFNKLAVGRELKMVELKKKVKMLEAKLKSK